MAHRFFSMFALAGAAVFAASSAHAAEPRAVVELFTSQGCSSCPPADRVLGEFTHDPSVIALSVPVDYWDYLGWKDTLALPGNSGRQRAYSRSRGDRDVFTPQAIINGMVSAVGSDKSAVEGAITKTRSKSPLTVPVKLAVNGGKVTVDVPAGNGGGEVWLCPISREIPVAIGRGENTGSSVTYYNVVRRWVKLGDWSGKAASFNVPVSEISAGGADSVAVLVQSGNAGSPGMMLGAALATLR